MMDGKAILDKFSGFTGKSESEIIADKTKGTFTSTAIGAAIGLVVGYNRHYSLLMSAFVGGAIGGIVGSYFIKK